MIKLSQFSENYSFPSHDVDPALKSKKEYCLQFCRAFYSAWLRGDTLYGLTDKIKFEGLRRMAVGKQPDDLYYELCYGRGKDGEIIRKGYMNVNWEILKVMVKYRNAFIGMFTDVEFEAQATSINPFATREREEKKWKTWVESKIMPDIMVRPEAVGAVGEIPGASPNASIPVEPKNITELEVLESLGFFRLEEELAYQQAIRATFDVISRFPETIKDKILEDLWDIGRVLTKDYVDIPTQKVKVRYADIANSVIRRRTDGSILDGGEFRLMSIADLRAESDFTEDELCSIAQGFVGYFGNMNSEEWTRNKGQSMSVANGNFAYSTFYDGIKIMVLDCEYYTVDKKHITEVSTEKGITYHKEEYGKVRNSPKRKTKVNKQATYYRAIWPVGTDLLYNYGLQYDIPRPDLSEARSSYHYEELTTPSPVEVASPIAHNVQLAWLKFQNAWAKAKPDGWAYDEGLLINSTIGGKIKPDQLVRMSEQTGRLFFKTANARGENILAPNSSAPIYAMPGGIGQAANEFVMSWNLFQDMLQELLGMPPQAVASPLPAKTGKGVSEIALGASNNVMRPMINCYRNLKQSMSLNVLMRIKIVFAHNKEVANEYRDILGEAMVQLIKDTADKSASQYGINLVMRINDAMRQKIEQAAYESMNVDRNGGVGISPDEFVLIQSLLDQGADPKMIQGALAMFTQRRKREMDEAVAANSKQQSDQIIQQTQMAKMEEAKQMVLKAMLEIKVKQAESEIDAEKFIGEQFMGVMMQEAMGVVSGELGAPMGQQPMPGMGGGEAMQMGAQMPGGEEMMPEMSV